MFLLLLQLVVERIDAFLKRDAIRRQMDELPFAPRRFTNEPAVALAAKLAAIAPGGLSKVLFTTGGSDANEVALKVARAATGRYKTVSFWDSFHGAGFGAASIGGEALFRSGPIGPGTYLIRTGSGAWRAPDTEVEVRPGETTELELAFEPATE